MFYFFSINFSSIHSTHKEWLHSLKINFTFCQSYYLVFALLAMVAIAHFLSFADLVEHNNLFDFDSAFQ